MNKIPTLFCRDPNDMRHVLNRVTPGCEWVLYGEGIATRKFDGTCVMFAGEEWWEGWWARREVKPGKQAPLNFRAVDHDEVTGKTVGWEPIEQSPFAKFHAEALDNPGILEWPPRPGTFELCGPKINKNPEGLAVHTLIRHATAARLTPPYDFDGLAAYLLADRDREGIVWHHPDGRMAKLKRRDFS